MKAVALTGLGVVCCLGHEAATITSAVRRQEHGLRPWEPAPGLPPRPAGLLPGFGLGAPSAHGWTWPGDLEIEPALIRQMPPHGVPVLVAARNAFAEAGWSRDELANERTGLAVASPGSPRLIFHHLKALETKGWRNPHPLGVLMGAPGGLAFTLAAHWGVKGPVGCHCTGCVSAAVALCQAAEAVASGSADRMIVAAGEDLAAETFLPFDGLGALSRQADPRLASRPFDAGRDGFVPAGGAAVLAVESLESARARGLRPLAILRGWAQCGDGWHAVQPHPEGDGIGRAMKLAMENAGCETKDITYINAHAASTPAGDRAEASAILRLFGPGGPPVSSLKALLGHCLNAASGVELAVALRALGEGFLPAQSHLVEVDPECAGLHLPREPLPFAGGLMLKNGVGFGGANVALILEIP